MLKQIGVFMGLFVIAVTAITVFNDDVEGDELFETSLHSSGVIDPNANLVINALYNKNIKYDLTDEELSEFSASRISIVETSSLTDTIEVYTINLYGDIVATAEITLIGNEITILSDLGPMSTYANLTFLPYAQFDYNYIEGMPYRIYEIHIPEGLTYSFN